MVEGNPVPTYKWSKGGRDVIMAENKIRCITDGDSGQVSLVISKCKPHDEGDYTLVFLCVSFTILPSSNLFRS